jgi:hypothetical protein
MAKCPQCEKEVAPKKTWKMAGRPDKTGKRTELTIGLCECCEPSEYQHTLLVWNASYLTHLTGRLNSV